MGSIAPSEAAPALVEQLKRSLKNSEVLVPGDEGYAQSVVRWSDAWEKKAGIVVYVGGPEDVSTTLKFCREHNIQFVVSGGKHSVGGFSSITGGLVIDLAKLREVTVNEADMTFTAGGGCIWKDVDEGAAKYGLAGVGGTINHTGVGGLSCAGGYGWLTGRYGLTIDNVLAAEVVLADGSIVEASEKSNPDLYWAIRGAGHCFGVITRFTFRAHRQTTPIWAGQMVFSAAEHLDAVINFANELTAKGNPDVGMLMGITAPPFVRGPALVVTAFVNGSKSEGEAIFGPLLALSPIKNNCEERPYCTMNGIMNHAVDYGGRKISQGVAYTLPLQPDFIRGIVEELSFLHQEIPATRRSILLFEFYQNGEFLKVPTEATAFGYRGKHQNALIAPYWDDAKDDEKCVRWLSHMVELFRGELTRVGAQTGEVAEMAAIGTYANYDGLRVTPQEIFGTNYPRLVELKAKYDPTNMFNGAYDLTGSAV